MLKNYKIIYFANINSPHIKRWIEVSKTLNVDIQIITIHKPTKSFDNLNYKYILPIWATKLGVLKYVIAGIYAKKNLKKESFYLVHAHNTSGYGLMALVSKYKYIITTYGSEIYEAKERGFFYKKLIKLILNKSYKITATSIKMKNELEEKFNIIDSKINLFSLGTNEEIFNYKKNTLRHTLNITEKSKVWIVNRRVTPLYCTYEVVQGFIKYTKESNSDNKLIIICGDYDSEYLKKVESISLISNIIFIKELLSQEALSEFLSIADFSISVPKTDQLSASILESMACETIPILSNLEAYEVLKKFNVGIFINGLEKKDFYEIFMETSLMSMEIKNNYLKICKNFIREYESKESVQKNLIRLYNIKGI